MINEVSILHLQGRSCGIHQRILDNVTCLTAADANQGQGCCSCSCKSCLIHLVQRGPLYAVGEPQLAVLCSSMSRRGKSCWRNCEGRKIKLRLCTDMCINNGHHDNIHRLDWRRGSSTPQTGTVLPLTGLPSLVIQACVI